VKNSKGENIRHFSKISACNTTTNAVALLNTCYSAAASESAQIIRNTEHAMCGCAIVHCAVTDVDVARRCIITSVIQTLSRSDIGAWSMIILSRESANSDFQVLPKSPAESTAYCMHLISFVEQNPI